MPGWITRGLASWRVCFGGLWQPFNRWRRERWPVRVVIIVLLGSYSFAYDRVGPFAPGVHRIAIEGILNGCEGSLVAAGARFYKAREADRLRRSLRLYLDADRDSKIGPHEADGARGLGLEAADLVGSVLDADLNALVDAARRAGLVPASYTARDVRRAAISVGRSQADEIFVPVQRDVSRMLAEAGPSPRNWSLSSWWQTAIGLFSLGMQILGVADWITVVAWLFLCYFAARLAVTVAGERARRLAPWSPPGLILLLGLLAWLLHEPDLSYPPSLFFDWWAFFVRVAGWAVFSFCAAHAGSGHVCTEADRTMAALRTVADLGGVIFAWGMLNMFLWVALCRLGAWRDFYPDPWALSQHSGYFMTWSIPLLVKEIGALTGASIIAYAALRIRRASRAAGVPDEHGAKK